MLRRLRRDTKFGFATRAIHVGYDPADAQGALTPPVHLTSTYAFELAEHGAEVFAGIREGYAYGRTKNPTQAHRRSGRRGSRACRRLRNGRNFSLDVDAAGGSSHVIIDRVLTAIVMRSLPGD